MNTEENMIPIEPYLKDFKQYLDANSRLYYLLNLEMEKAILLATL